jgi:hypothetical protein
VNIRSPYDDIPMDTKPRYVLGLDLGQKQDYSVLALAKIIPSPDSTPERNFDRIQIVGLRRYELRTPYPSIVDKVAETARNPALRFDISLGVLPGPVLLVDATGVGAATTDLFLSREMGTETVPITITSGREAREDRWNDTRTAS